MMCIVSKAMPLLRPIRSNSRRCARARFAVLLPFLTCLPSVMESASGASSFYDSLATSRLELATLATSYKLRQPRHGAPDIESHSMGDVNVCNESVSVMGACKKLFVY